MSQRVLMVRGSDDNENRTPVLLVSVSQLLCALPLAGVREVLRPLELRNVPEMPRYIEGAALIRGEVVPVVDLAVLLEQEASGAERRWVLLEPGEHRVAVSVTGIKGVASFRLDDFGPAPPLFSRMNHALIESLAVRDQELLVVLRTARIVPDELWPRLSDTMPKQPARYGDIG